MNKLQYFLLIFLLVFFFKEPLINKIIEPQRINVLDATQKTNDKHNISLLDFSQNKWNIISLTQNTWKETLLPHPFIAYSEHGLIANYTESANEIAFYLHGELFTTFNNKSLFPVITYPFILLLSSDKTYAEIYQFTGKDFHLIKEISTNSIITSYQASANGQYLVIGNLSNEILLLNTANPDEPTLSLSLNIHNKAIYGVGITNEGIFYALGSYNPMKLVYGNINKPENTETLDITENILATSQQFISTDNLFFITSYSGFQVFSVNNKSIKEIILPSRKPYPLVTAHKINSKKLALLYEITPNEYILDIISHYKTINYSTHIETKSIPQFIRNSKKESLLITKELGLIL